MTDWVPAATLAAALAIDAAFGEPAWLYRRVPHPVVLIGGLIGWVERRFNPEPYAAAGRRWAGAGALAAVLVLVGGSAWLVQTALLAVPGGWLAVALLASTLIAQRSLYEHVAAVAAALETGGLAAGRSAVARIVGRDPDSLDQAGVARAAVESCAENFSDGVVAPVFWFVLLGLPGLAVYKAVNTADSMIGHRSPRYLRFGWAAARLDDVLNLVPARGAGLILALGAGVMLGRAAALAGVRAMWFCADQHRSPNAGWPEAAMAGALGLALAGPRRYRDHQVDDPWLNPGGRRAATAGDVRAALRVMAAGCAVGWVAAVSSLW